MKTPYNNRIVKNVVDRDGNIVVAILKYNTLSCLFHSFYGIIVILLLVGTVASIALGYSLGAVVPGVVFFFFWLKAWLNANDKLKEHIYPELLEKHLMETGIIEGPFIVKDYNADAYVIECITDKGDNVSYKVEVMQEKLPLYVVKIHVI